MAISPFRPDARGMTAAVPQMASVYNDLKQGTPFKAGGGPGLDAWRSPAIAQSAAGLGMPTGGPALDLRSLEGAARVPNPGAGMGPWGGGPPRVLQNAGQMDPRLAGAARPTAPSPWAAYGGAFGGVNQNDLYRKNAPNTAGPNGMMGAAPNLDFNQMARSQVGGQGARYAAEMANAPNPFVNFRHTVGSAGARALEVRADDPNRRGQLYGGGMGQWAPLPGLTFNKDTGTYTDATGIIDGDKENARDIWGNPIYDEDGNVLPASKRRGATNAR